jgi:hypothetical protein
VKAEYKQREEEEIKSVIGQTSEAVSYTRKLWYI